MKNCLVFLPLATLFLALEFPALARWVLPFMWGWASWIGFGAVITLARPSLRRLFLRRALLRLRNARFRAAAQSSELWLLANPVVVAGLLALWHLSWLRSSPWVILGLYTVAIDTVYRIICANFSSKIP